MDTYAKLIISTRQIAILIVEINNFCNLAYYLKSQAFNIFFSREKKNTKSKKNLFSKLCFVSKDERSGRRFLRIISPAFQGQRINSEYLDLARVFILFYFFYLFFFYFARALKESEEL